LVRGHRVRGLAASPPYGALLLYALHQGKFFLSVPKRNTNSYLRIVKCKYERRVIHDIIGCHGDEALGHNASFEAVSQRRLLGDCQYFGKLFDII
jgi:hypothetical protein